MRQHEQKIREIIRKMPLTDKIALCEGASFWETKAFPEYGIPAMFLCDGPHGLRKQESKARADMLGVHQSAKATCFPAEDVIASGWDPELAGKIGKAIGEEALAQNVSVVLGPGVNIKRNPLCGRNFEYFSEDPVLAGKLAAGFVRGLESCGVGACLKHFAANSQEKSRFNSDSVIDERTLRELYLPAFERAVKKGKPSAVMCAYPKLNGIHCSDNRNLLTEILREEWGFDGMVVTDWAAMNNRIEGFRAGCDLNMPGGSNYMGKETIRAVQGGKLPEADVDRSAGRILSLAFRSADVRSRYRKAEDEAALYEEHNALAGEAAEQGAVLLKNEDGILPLSGREKLAVIGHMAKDMRFQGSGSSHVHAVRVSQPLSYFRNAAYAEGCDKEGNTSDRLLSEVRKKASESDRVIVFAGLPERYESEGFDRTDMQMPEGHLRMIEAAVSANPETVVVLLCGSPVECPWADRVKGILYLGLPGQAGGEAVFRLLFGEINPSGRLAETWPIRYEDCPSASFYGKTRDALYLEGMYSGYRYYQKAGQKVRWPFGYGLSYTEFSYSDLKIEKPSGRWHPISAEKPEFTVRFVVKNTGKRAGAEVAQLYVEAPQDGVHRPVRLLRRFQKITLEAGEEKTVSFLLNRRDFAMWQDRCIVPTGTYRIAAGKNCDEICMRKEIRIEGEDVSRSENAEKKSWYDTCKGIPCRKDLEQALGKPIRIQRKEKGTFTMDNTILEMKDSSLVMRMLYQAVKTFLAVKCNGRQDPQNPEFRMQLASSVGSPLRCLQISGGLRGGLMQGLLEIANGHYGKGIKKIICG